MQLPTVPPSGSLHIFILPQSVSEAQLVLQAAVVASQAYAPHGVDGPAMQLPFMHVDAPLSLPLLPSHAAAAQAVPSG